ncbi:hypothetical protein AQULUS_01910 [Aquicella lusitana]|uniref:Uncharacterized protein n=2 Tax=Aquicella lusitana TaxID=254246 RepID=A0A370GMR0_9COXI|nr:hypothetical protein C8D86_10961 [Aquicella lusitana]VVC72479.1 hypothetical protein AQULUS_01910 [Aquicella lusitana]
MKNCITTVKLIDNKTLAISDGNTSIGEYNNGSLILSMLKKAAREQNIDMGITEPVTGLFCTAMAIKFMVKKNADIALKIIKEKFPETKIIQPAQENEQQEKKSAKPVVSLR